MLERERWRTHIDSEPEESQQLTNLDALKVVVSLSSPCGLLLLVWVMSQHLLPVCNMWYQVHTHMLDEVQY